MKYKRKNNQQNLKRENQKKDVRNKYTNKQGAGKDDNINKGFRVKPNKTF